MSALDLEEWFAFQMEPGGRFTIGNKAAALPFTQKSWPVGAADGAKFVADVRGPGLPYPQSAESTATAHLLASAPALARLAIFVLDEVTCLDNYDFNDCGECAACAARDMAAKALTKAGIEHNDGCACVTCSTAVRLAAEKAGF